MPSRHPLARAFRKLSPCRLPLALALSLAGSVAFARADKFRLVLTDDPSTTATIAWNQASGEQPSIRYDEVDRGGNVGAYAKTRWPDRLSTHRGMRTHFVRLRGLRPNTAYYFVVADTEGASQRLWFKTAPADRSRLSLIAGGDSRNNREVRRRANLLVAKLRPHAVLFGGDMIDGDSETEWREWLDDWQLTTTADGRLTPIVPTRGNHEAPGTVARLFDLPDEREYYALTFGAGLLRVYTLNTETSVAGDQRDWLAADLAAHRGARWRIAQYHRPMRPHTNYKPEGTAQYTAWAQLFADERVRLVIDCDSHVSKTTWPVRPSYGPGSAEGFIRDDANGTVYTGEGCWGAPLKRADKGKPWTRTLGAFHEFKLLFVSETTIEHRTVRVDNAYAVADGNPADPFALPAGLDVVAVDGRDAIVILPYGPEEPVCALAGAVCDDGRPETRADEQDGNCQCAGIPATAREFRAAIAAPTHDAEEHLPSGRVNLWSSDLELIDDWGAQAVGLRFEGVVLPKGATVYRAYIQFCVDQPSSEPTNLTIRGERTLPSLPFAGTTSNLSARQTTAAEVAWRELAPWSLTGVCGLPQRSPDVSAVVREVVGQPDWQSGSALHFLLRGSGRRVARSYESGAGAELIVYYDTGTPTCPPAGQICDDGRADTRDDRTDGNCGCAGTPACPPAGQICDDGRADTRDDRTDGNCGCAGAPACPPAGQICDDGRADTRDDRTDGNCGCAGAPACPPAGQFCDDGRADTRDDRTDGNCGCAGTPFGGGGIEVTATFTIARGDDDAEESVTGGGMYLNSSDLEMSEDPGTPGTGEQIVGLRFAGVAIPPGAIIRQAHLQFVADESHTRTTDLWIVGERAGASAPFRNAARDLSLRARTQAQVTWSQIGAWQSGQVGSAQRSPDLSAVVAEVTAQAGWASGNALTLFVGGRGQRVAVSYDGGRDRAARLVVTYVAPVGGRVAEGPGTGLGAAIDRGAAGGLVVGAEGTSVVGVSRAPSIYPNPVRERVTIAGVDETRWRGGALIDGSGRVVATLAPGATQLEVGHLPGGLYALRLHSCTDGPDWVSWVRVAGR